MVIIGSKEKKFEESIFLFRHLKSTKIYLTKKYFERFNNI